MLNSANQSDNSLVFDDSKLTKFLNTIHPVNGNRLPTWNLITADRFTKVYANELDPNALYTRILSQTPVEDLEVIWTNYAPCPDCAKSLITKYDKPELAKPIIYIGRLVNDTASRDMKHVIRVLQCMAKLIHKGFEIRAWNVNEFKEAAVFTVACNTKIDEFNSNSNFTSAVSYLRSLQDFVGELGRNDHANTWC